MNSEPGPIGAQKPIVRFLKRIEDLKIHRRLLEGHSAIFILSSILARATIDHFVRQAIEANIESELRSSTTAILNVVRNAANVSIENYLQGSLLGNPTRLDYTME